MLRRPQYLARIMRHTEQPVVKILTGIKRAGKTTLLQTVQDDLIARGVPKKNIVTFSFEGQENAHLTTSQSLYDAVAARAVYGERIHVFLEEVQRVHDWERAALLLLHDVNPYLYISGSNGAAVSKSVMDVLDDKFEHIPVSTLSFAEYLEFKEAYAATEDKPRELVRYLMTGGFPSLHRRAHTQAEAYTYIRDVMNAALWTDVAGLAQLRRTDQLDRVMRFVFENVGNVFSAKHLSDSLKSENKEINIETVYTYLERLETAYIISRCRRYDIQSDAPLKTQEKFYLSDPAIRYAALGFKPESVAAGLENIVYLELKRRGYDVYMGKLGRKEIDFVAIRPDGRMYVQLGRDLRGEGGDYGRLSSVRDNYPKYILTTDESAVGNRNGIYTVNITNFLLDRI